MTTTLVDHSSMGVLSCCSVLDATRSVLEDGTASRVFSPVFPPTPLPVGERVEGNAERTARLQGSANRENIQERTPPAGTVLYVATTLASFQVAPDPDIGRIIYAKDMTWDGFPYRRLDGHWFAWLASRVAKAGDRLSAAQREAWIGIAEWASVHGIRPSPTPYGYLPPAAFTTPGRWDAERTDKL